MPVPLATPVAVRSCRRAGGEWRWCHEYGRGEQAALEALATNERDLSMLKREIKRLLERASRGQLRFGKKDDVWTCTTGPSVLELRFDQRVQFPNGKRAVRLYFSEPACDEGILLMVRLAAKPASKDGLDVQDDHIREAELRVRKHYRL